jgi:hypothetical protein
MYDVYIHIYVYIIYTCIIYTYMLQFELIEAAHNARVEVRKQGEMQVMLMCIYM